MIGMPAQTRGFTLIELLVVLVIVLAILLPILSLNQMVG